MDEAGRVMTPEAAIAMFARSNAWLKERRLNGPATCGCGACWLCAYNTFVRMREALERLGSVEAFRRPFALSHGIVADEELKARIDYARAALEGR